MLAVLETHPVQYHAPVYRRLVTTHGLRTTAVYGSDYSVRGGLDREFGTHVRWDVDLLGGYEARFVRPGSQPPVVAGVRELRAALHSVAPRAVLLTGYAGPFHRSALAAAWSLRVPLIFRAETTDHALSRGTVRRAGRDVVLRALYGRFGALCPIGTRSRAHYLRLGVSASRLFDAPYDVDTTPFRSDETARAELREETRRALGIPGTAYVVLYSGKLSERKGVDDLAAAVEGLGADVHVVLLGDGELRASLERRLGVSMPRRAHFVGFRNQTELSPYFHASDVLALPSRRSETWGLVVNEALHHGLPVVATTAVGSVPDLVFEGRTGFAVPPERPAELRGALDRARTLHGEQVRAGCRAVVERVSLDRAAAGLMRAYAAVTG